MNTLLPFTYGDQPVRVVSIDGEPWFVLADLCKVLDLTQPNKVALRIADDMKGRNRIPTPGGDQEMTIVSEAGMELAWQDDRKVRADAQVQRLHERAEKLRRKADLIMAMATKLDEAAA